jgi:hypothetical protein
MGRQQEVTEDLAHLAELVDGFSRAVLDTSDVRSHNFSPIDRKAYNDAFALVERLCRTFYPGSEEASYAYERWESRVSKYLPQTGATIVPFPGEMQTQLSERLLKATTLYSDLTILVLPTNIEDGYISYSGGDRKTLPEIQPVFRYTKRYVSQLKAGRIVFLPRSSYHYEGSLSEETQRRYSAPFEQPAAQLSFLPMNLVGTSALGASPIVDLQIFDSLLLPFFPNASLNDIVRIAEKETDSFLVFNQFLSQRLKTLSSAQSVDALRDIIGEIKAGVAQLNLEARRVQRTGLVRGSELGIFSLSLVTLLLGDVGQLSQIAGVAGTVSLIDLIREFAQPSTRAQLRSSEFYVPYLLSKK